MADKAGKQRKKREPQQSERKLPPESRQSEVLTVVWTLTIMATLGAELLLLIAGTVLFFLRQQPQPEGADEAVKQVVVHPFAMIPGVLMFIAALTGMICLLLTPLVYRIREVAPPRAITAVAILASIVPLVTAIWSILSRG